MSPPEPACGKQHRGPDNFADSDPCILNVGHSGMCHDGTRPFAPVPPTPDPINTAYEECAALCQGLAQDYADVKNDEAMLAAEWCAAGLRKLAEETAARAPVTPTPPVCEHCWGSGTEPSGEAAPPPAGVLHPLALAYLEAHADGIPDRTLWARRADWEQAGQPIYTAAPPTLSAEEREHAAIRATWDVPDLTDAELAAKWWACMRGEAATGGYERLGNEMAKRVAARAPVPPAPEIPEDVKPLVREALAASDEMNKLSPREYAERIAPSVVGTPEPATVEPVCAGPFVDARDCPVHAKDLRPPEPARPPAVTRTIRERIGDHVTAKQWDDRMLRVEALAAVVDGLVQVLDEDEARRDADRRETR